MSGDVRVGRKLEFYHPASRMGKNAPVQGEFNLAKVTFDEDFFQDTFNTDAWAASVGNGGNAPAIIVGANGIVNIATNSSSLDATEVEGEACWYARQACAMEIRFKLPNITTVAMNAGFVNAYSNTNDKIAFLVGGSNAITLGTNVTEAACAVFDTGADTDKWFCCTTIGGAAAQGGLALMSTAPVNSTYEVWRIELDISGNAHFYRNGVEAKTIATAVDPTVALRPYFAVAARTTAARELHVDYIKLWQSRPETSTVIW